MRTRRNVYTLPAGDKTLYWYGQAVAAMQARPATDPRSWEWQAAIHGTVANVPPAARPYWNQCQHASSFFLPWHRMYLLHFERIVAEHVERLGGPANWALPYWNYSAKTAWRVLPAEFRNPTLPGGSPNPLHVAARRKVANSSKAALATRDVDLSSALGAAATTVPGGFFGDPPPAHFGSYPGMLEGGVHNNVHVAIGGSTGWMGNPDQAALDPIFWLHHANIDRLWQVWLARDPAHVNLASPYWRTGVSFPFHDASGKPVRMRVVDVLDLADPGVDYDYDDTTDPLAAAAPSAMVAASVPTAAPVSMPQPSPGELVGASTTPIELSDHVQHADVPTPVTPHAFAAMSAPGAMMAPTAAPSTLVQRVMLMLEHVTSQANGLVYDVYLNVPAGEEPDARDDLFVGRASMFGVAQASDPARQHGGGGQSFAFDITPLYRSLSDAGEIDVQQLRVTFVPVGVESGVAARVGRISVYFA